MILPSIIGFLYKLKRIPDSIFILVFILMSFFVEENCLAQDGYRLRKVVIDAGHGGKDPGAVGLQSNEKDIVLSIALKVGKYIEDNHKDVEVIFTRKEDVFVEVFRRADIANEKNADLFISIHANASKDKRAYGSETFAMGLHTSKENLEVARKENRAILFEENYADRYEGYDPNSPESFIIFSLMQNTFLHQSLDFASHIQNQFRDRARRIDRGVKQAGFLVLWRTTMPSVLIEVGFISNPDEEKYLMSEEGQAHLASAIYRAFREYKETIEKRSNSGSFQVNRIQPVTDGNIQTTAATRVVKSDPESPEGLGQVRNTSHAVIFRVQVSASSNRVALDSDFFKGLDNVSEFHSDRVYRYTVGQANTLEEGVELRRRVNEFFPDAFLVASHNGKLISVQEALKHLNP